MAWLEPELEMELEVVGRSAVGAGSRAVLVLVLGWLLPRLPCCEGGCASTHVLRTVYRTIMMACDTISSAAAILGF